MIIKSMHLEHYRCFDNFDIEFDDRLTVLVGVNGAGKTAVLDALGVFLKWIQPNRGGYPKMVKSDLEMGRMLENIVYRLMVLNDGDNGNEPIEVEFSDPCFEDEQTIIFVSDNISNLSQKIHNTLKTLCVSYMSGRLIHENDTALKENFYSPIANAAYTNAFTRTIDYASTLSWFNNADADEARAMRDAGQRDEMPELKAVREALTKALLGQFERPRMLGSPPELVIYKKGTSDAYKVNQLSDGYRAMLALVMDLARRMAQIRNSDGQPGVSLLHIPAIVLIDEVELHLHPSWQQTVLTTLMDIFPKTQFIVTTHSPQVLTSIPPKHIRILQDVKAYTFGEQTQGAEASRLLKHVLGVESRPIDLGIVKDLKEYAKLVYDEKWDTPKALTLKKRLEVHYGDDEPELMELDLYVENKKWERDL